MSRKDGETWGTRPFRLISSCPLWLRLAAPLTCYPRGILNAMPKSKESHSGARTAIAIMAAGKGTRLKSTHPKVLHEVGGKPLLAHAIAAATKLVPAQDVYAIIGHEADRVRAAVAHTGVGDRKSVV